VDLCRHYHVVAATAQRRAHDPLGFPVLPAVAVGGIYDGDPRVKGGRDDARAFGMVGVAVSAEHHRA
jgi:hypothetical protein